MYYFILCIVVPCRQGALGLGRSSAVVSVERLEPRAAPRVHQIIIFIQVPLKVHSAHCHITWHLGGIATPCFKLLHISWVQWIMGNAQSSSAHVAMVNRQVHHGHHHHGIFGLFLAFLLVPWFHAHVEDAGSDRLGRRSISVLPWCARRPMMWSMPRVMLSQFMHALKKPL